MASSSRGTEPIVAGKGRHFGKSRKLADHMASKQETSGNEVWLENLKVLPAVMHFLLLKVPQPSQNGTISWGPCVKQTSLWGHLTLKPQSANHLKNLWTLPEVQETPSSLEATSCQSSLLHCWYTCSKSRPPQVTNVGSKPGP